MPPGSVLIGQERGPKATGASERTGALSTRSILSKAFTAQQPLKQVSLLFDRHKIACPRAWLLRWLGWILIPVSPDNKVFLFCVVASLADYFGTQQGKTSFVLCVLRACRSKIGGVVQGHQGGAVLQDSSLNST